MKQLTWLTPYQPPEYDDHDGSTDAIMSRVSGGSQQPSGPSVQQAQTPQITMSQNAQNPQESHPNAPLRLSTSPSGSSDQGQSPLPSVQGLLEVSRSQDAMNTAGYEHPLGMRPSHAQALEPCASTCPLEKFALSYRLGNGAPCHHHGPPEKPFNILALGVNPTKQAQALPHDSRIAPYELRGPLNASTTTPHPVHFHHHPLRNASGNAQLGSRPGQVTSNSVDTTSVLPDSVKAQRIFSRNQQRYILPQTTPSYSPSNGGIPNPMLVDVSAQRPPYQAPILHQQSSSAAHSPPHESSSAAKSPNRGIIKASHNQSMLMEEKFSRTIPLINIEVIPPSSPNKRERHLEIAQRSRQRRKERELSLTGSSNRHNSREYSLTMQLDYYRSERDFFRDLVKENHIPFPPRPLSPSLAWHHRNAAAMTSTGTAPTSLRQSESKEHGTNTVNQVQSQCGTPRVADIAAAPPGPPSVQSGPAPTPHLALQPDNTGPMLSEYFSKPIKRECVEMEDENRMEF